jgi:hypothetical protein
MSNGTAIRDGAMIERVLQLVSDTCRYCGCHGGECAIGGGETCAWLTTTIPRTLCNSPRCAARAEIDKKISKRKVKGRVA